MKMTELRQKTELELKELLLKTKKELLDTSSNILQRKEKNVKKPRAIRKQIAQIKTLLAEAK